MTAFFVAGASAALALDVTARPLLVPLFLLPPILACRRPSFAAALLCAVAGGVMAGAGHNRSAGRSCEAALPVDTEVRLLGAFVDRPRGDRRAAALDVVEAPMPCSGSVTVVLPRGATVAPGRAVEVEGRWIVPPPRGRRGRRGLLLAARVDDTGPGGGLRSRVHAARDRVEARFEALFPRRWPMVHALVLARKADLEPDIRDDFARTGLAHLLAISGFHVGVVAGLLFAAARWLGRGMRDATLIAAVGVWGYVAAIGLPDAAVRAAVILSVAAAARARGRPAHSPGALAAALLAMCLADPAAISRVGLQLSFAGAAGLVLWSGPLDRWLAVRLGPRFPSPVRSAAAAGVAATLSTLPLVAWHFERVSLVGIPATLAAGPLVAAAIPGIFASLAVSLVSPALGGFVAGGTEWLLDAVLLAVAAFARLPFASADVPRTLVPVAAAGCVAAMVLARRQGHLRRRARRGVAAAGAVAAVVAWPALATLSGSGTLQVTFLDVGQGDAIALRSPRGRWVLVDTGPRTEGSDAGATVVAPFFLRQGVGRLEAMILTHPDLDHIGGAPAVLDALHVEAVFDPGDAAGKATYVDVLERVAVEGAPWLPLSAGRTLELDGVVFETLHPPPPETRDPAANSNDGSVVLSVRYGDFTLLLTGDAEAGAEARMVGSGAIGAVHVLKVGHHGSTTSSTRRFLERTAPEVAVISAGRRNRYGHPAAEVLERLDRLGARVLRTDLHGTVRVRARRDGSYTVHHDSPG